MTHLPQTLGYVCRSCRRTLGINTVRIRHHRDAIRSFSNSPSLLKTLATFTLTSSPELDTLLGSWRKEIFLPSVLSPHHRDLVYKTSRKEILTAPPGVSVSVPTAVSPSAPNGSTVEEETIKLEPMNLFDRPNMHDSFNTITQQLEENTDARTWDNLIPFLDGLRVARIKPEPHFLPRLARIASSTSVARWNTILTAATMSARTDVTLAHQDLTQQLVTGVFQRAADSKFSHPEPAKTLQRIAMLLESPDHCGGRIPKSTNKIKYADMRNDMEFLTVQSVFAAASVLREKSGKDVDGSATKAIRKLLVLEKTKSGTLLTSVDGKLTANQRGNELWKHNAILTGLTPLYAAFAFTLKVNMQTVLGKEKAVQTQLEMQKILRDVKTRVDAARTELVRAQKGQQATTENSTPRGLLLLKGVEGFLASI